MRQGRTERSWSHSGRPLLSLSCLQAKVTLEGDTKSLSYATPRPFLGDATVTFKCQQTGYVLVYVITLAKLKRDVLTKEEEKNRERELRYGV